MKQFIQKVKSYILQEQLILPGMNIIAGVSGGADSVCLLHCLSQLEQELNFTLTVVHVEHGIRGEASLEDAVFTRRLCESLGIDCRVFHVEAEKEARSRKISLEEAGRILRYSAFDEVRSTLTEPVRIATAHHRDDQAETVLMNLVRGTGIKGLGGIRPLLSDRIHPLLDVSRQEIEGYLLAAGQSWRTDATNEQDHYTRNVVRNQVLPLMMQRLNEETVKHISEAAQEAGQISDYLEREAERALFQVPAYQAWLSDSENRPLRLPLPFLKKQDALLRRVMWRMVISGMRQGKQLKDISRTHIMDLEALLDKPEGKYICLPNGLRARMEQDHMLLWTQKENIDNEAEVTEKTGRYLCERPIYLKHPAGELSVPGGKLCYVWMDAGSAPENIPDCTYTKWLACDTMEHDICVRTRQSGDYLTISRDGGRKKLKDYLIDCKIPRMLRAQQLLIARGSEVLWVIGHRMSESAKIDSHTEKVLRVTFTPDAP